MDQMNSFLASLIVFCFSKWKNFNDEVEVDIQDGPDKIEDKGMQYWTHYWSTSVQGNSSCLGPAIWELSCDFWTKSYFNFLQRLPSMEVYVKIGVPGGFAGFVGEVTVLWSLFNKAATLRACGFVDGRLQHGCFSGKASDSLNFDILRG